MRYCMRIDNCLLKKIKCIIFISCISLFLLSSKTYAFNSGSCLSIDDETKRSIIRGNKSAFVIKQNANIYKNELTNSVDGVLDFNEKIWITGIAEDRVKIETKAGERKWMNKADLLCSERPLKTKGKQGLEKKFIVCPESIIRSYKKFSVKAYSDPISDVCNNDCKNLIPFTSYFFLTKMKKDISFL